MRSVPVEVVPWRRRAVDDFIQGSCLPFRGFSHFCYVALNARFAVHGRRYLPLPGYRGTRQGQNVKLRQDFIAVIDELVAEPESNYSSRESLLDASLAELLALCLRSPRMVAKQYAAVFVKFEGGGVMHGWEPLTPEQLKRFPGYYDPFDPRRPRFDELGGPICCPTHRRAWLPATRFTAKTDFPSLDFTDREACIKATEKWQKKRAREHERQYGRRRELEPHEHADVGRSLADRVAGCIGLGMVPGQVLAMELASQDRDKRLWDQLFSTLSVRELPSYAVQEIRAKPGPQGT